MAGDGCVLGNGCVAEYSVAMMNVWRDISLGNIPWRGMGVWGRKMGVCEERGYGCLGRMGVCGERGYGCLGRMGVWRGMSMWRGMSVWWGKSVWRGMSVWRGRVWGMCVWGMGV